MDKVLPQLAWLAPEFEGACSPSKFLQADASKERTVTSHSGPPGPPTPLQVPSQGCTFRKGRRC